MQLRKVRVGRELDVPHSLKEDYRPYAGGTFAACYLYLRNHRVRSRLY
jgi:hypothetical protein